MGVIRPCHDLERPRILEIVNCAAEAYRNVIPPDRWHEPYMPWDELDQELSAGVRFWGYEADDHWERLTFSPDGRYLAADGITPYWLWDLAAEPPAVIPPSARQLSRRGIHRLDHAQQSGHCLVTPTLIRLSRSTSRSKRRRPRYS